MTPALKKMVEAMRAELEGFCDYDQWIDIKRNIDLEALARAGLEAIKEPDREQVLGYLDGGDDERPRFWSELSAEMYRAMIAEILKDQP